MHSETANLLPDETHEQFVRRASGIFPVERVRNWSRIERAVFNHLMGHLIHEHSYASITDAMLARCRDDMCEIVRRCQPG
ncbi:MAG: hypothetical protein CVU18_03300 [Betaproteobacteria bacterium HGW-Betaproteobacteria-12]|jgi:hypothetical protein|nr:MAG: hypothetical protein CVU18_03300 [Betaproteobacteria bacterium HGW-Betaproteobacteria-12]